MPLVTLFIYFPAPRLRQIQFWGSQFSLNILIILVKGCLAVQLTDDNVFKEEDAPRGAELCAGYLQVTLPLFIHCWVVWRKLQLCWSDAAPRQN